MLHTVGNGDLSGLCEALAFAVWKLEERLPRNSIESLWPRLPVFYFLTLLGMLDSSLKLGSIHLDNALFLLPHPFPPRGGGPQNKSQSYQSGAS